eukprot:4324496-Lingulodinium_polyedra.AAC.1
MGADHVVQEASTIATGAGHVGRPDNDSIELVQPACGLQALRWLIPISQDAKWQAQEAEHLAQLGKLAQ